MMLFLNLLFYGGVWLINGIAKYLQFNRKHMLLQV